ncbi:hypothetical protein KH5H1_58390 [Corallococcus caeni]|nr:hypothetical protein KH5H1_58390 [Corallococcus sp. KH5-1]
MTPWLQPQQHGAHEGPRAQVEWPSRLGGGVTVRLGFAAVLGSGLQRDDGQRERPIGVEPLDRRVPFGRERGAQDFMAPHQGLEGPLQRGGIQRSVEHQDAGHVVEGAAGLELIQEPQPLLRVGERHGAGARHRHERRSARAGVAPRAQRRHPDRERLHRGRGEEVAQRQLHAQRRAHARHHLRGQQGVAPQVEEVIVDAHASQVEHLGEEGGELFLHRVARRDVPVPGDHGRLGSGKGGTVQLAVGVEGQGFQHHEGAGDHVVGKPLVERGAQGLPLQRLANDVGHQALVSGDVLAHHGHGFPHTRQEAQGGLDLARLDAEAAQLHLEVGAPQELQRAIRAPARPVASAVEPRTRRRAERMGHEALGGEGGLVEVAPGQPFAADVQFPRHARRHRPHRRVQHVGGGVGQRTPDGNGGPHRVARMHRVGGGEGGVLRGPVAVDQHRTRRQPGQVFPHPKRREHVAARQHLRHGGERLRMVHGHLFEEGGREPQRGDLVLGEDRRDAREGQLARRRQHQPGPMQQRSPDFEGGSIERRRRELKDDLLRAEAHEAGVHHQPQHGAMRNTDALGRPRGARGEEDIGQPVPLRALLRHGGLRT